MTSVPVPSGGGDALSQPPTKKAKLENEKAGSGQQPQAPQPQQTTVLPLAGASLPVVTSTNFSGGISLTISNVSRKGVINLKTGGQGDGSNATCTTFPPGVTMVKGPGGNMVHTSVAGQMASGAHLPAGMTQLKIPHPRPLQFRMAPVPVSHVAGIPYSPTGMMTMAARSNLPIPPQTVQMVHPMSVQPLIQSNPQTCTPMAGNQVVPRIHPLAGTIIPASAVTAKCDVVMSSNGQTKDSQPKRKEQLIASKPPPGTVPIVKTPTSTGTAGKPQPSQVQLISSSPSASAKMPQLSVVPTSSQVPGVSVVCSQSTPLVSATPVATFNAPQLSLVRAQAPGMVSPQPSSGVACQPPPLSIIRAQQVSVGSSHAGMTHPPQLSIVHAQPPPLLAPQQPLVVTRHQTPKQGGPTVPGVAVMVSAVQSAGQVSLAGIKPVMLSAACTMSQPCTISKPCTVNSVIAQKPIAALIQQPVSQPRTTTQNQNLTLSEKTGQTPATPTSKPAASAQKSFPLTNSTTDQLEDKPSTTQKMPEELSSSSETVPKPDSTVPSVTVTPQEPPTTTSDFDPVDVMTWDNGIGTLPGSDLKFRMNEFGIMEMITDDTGLDGDVPQSDSLNSPDKTISTENTKTIHFEFVKSETSETAVQIKSEPPSNNKTDQTTFKKQTYKAGSVIKKKKKKTIDGVKREESMDTFTLNIKIPDTGSGKKTKGFVWSQYLDEEKAVGAPTKLFKEPFPQVRNGFKVGMRCEGIDPSHQSLFCVLSIAEVRGFRLRMRFDGYSESYDFWINADSPYIFPVGLCEKNNKKLEPPKGFTSDFEFNWGGYLKFSGGQAAPKHLFINQHSASFTPNLFRVGQKLEAVDRKNTSLICVATVADTLGDKILVHFDGWEDEYDYWCDPDSPYIHPIGWCQEKGKALSPPCDWADVSNFTWEQYLSKCKSTAVPARAFKPHPPVGFEPGMKLETVDKRNPILIRVATVKSVIDNQICIHFDGWSESYDFWVDDDSPDIHPPGWCGRTGHSLQPPVYPEDLIVSPGQGGCPTPGCKGMGHIKGAKYNGHHSAFGCPYSHTNMIKEVPLQDRLQSGRGEENGSGPTKSKLPEKVSPDVRVCPTPGCDGSGHVTGKYAAHSKVSGCPKSMHNLIKPKTLHTKEGLKFRPGRGRGRKKHKFLHWREKREREEITPGNSPEPSVTSPGNNLHNGIHQSVFMSAMVPNPAKDLPLCWDQHSKLLPGLDKIKGTQVASWTIQDVADFVKTLPGCEEQANVFMEEQIDGEAFLLLNQTDIVKIMNIKLGPALKIYNSILMFKSSVEA